MFPQRPSLMPFAPAVLRTASALYIFLVPVNAPSQKGSKQSVRSFRFTGVQLHSFTHCLHLLAGSQGGLCESGARSNASTVSCSRSRSGRRKAKKQSICHTFRFVHLPVSAGGPIVAVSTLFVEAAKSLPRAVNWS